MGITNSVIYALGKYGITVKERSSLYKFIGPPLPESFQKYFGFTEKEANNAVQYYREYYKEKGVFENLVYPGLIDLLKKLVASGKQLIVATSKPEIFAKQIMKHFKMTEYFIFIAGSNLDGTRVNKDEVISYALESCRITDKSKIIMVGDREHDIIGAKKTGISSIGVLYGYGSAEDLRNAGADYIVDSIAGIGKILLDE